MYRTSTSLVYLIGCASQSEPSSRHNRELSLTLTLTLTLALPRGTMLQAGEEDGGDEDG